MTATLPNPTLTPEAELYWLALRMIPGLGTRRTVQLLERFHTPQAILRASPQELEAGGLPPSLARSVASGCSFDDAASQQNLMRQAKAQIVPYGDPRYPGLLRDIYDPPPLLYAKGRIDLLDSIGIGLVGTRRPTPYGLAAAERLAADLARAGLTIISGMARGIDTACHKAALSVEGATIAVLGCGVDLVYPSENRKLADDLAAKGLIISEFPLGTPAYPQNFPVRNRIVSGLSVGVLIVEGAQYSGSAITAKLAADQGREVFAVPGNITNKMSWGPNLLIKQGAKLVQDWNDVVNDLPTDARRRLIEQGRQRLLFQGDTRLPEPGAESSATGTASLLSEPHQIVPRMVLTLLTVDTPIHLDTIIERLEQSDSSSGASPSEVIAALFELEILGFAKQLPGRQFVKVW